MPVLVLSGDIYPVFGGDFPGRTTLNSTQALAENVQGVIVPIFRTLDSRRTTRFRIRPIIKILW